MRRRREGRRRIEREKAHMNGRGGTNFKKSPVTPRRCTDVLIKKKRKEKKTKSKSIKQVQSKQ
jgi:hypothetical protein